MPLDQVHVIDVIAQDAQTGDVALIMTETRPWDGSDARLFQLQEKINAYLSFALDGEMVETYPQFAGRSIRLQLDCTEPPDTRTARFIRIVREQVAFQDIRFEVRVTSAHASEGCCGSGCGCDDPKMPGPQ